MRFPWFVHSEDLHSDLSHRGGELHQATGNTSPQESQSPGNARIDSKGKLPTFGGNSDCEYTFFQACRIPEPVVTAPPAAQQAPVPVLERRAPSSEAPRTGVNSMFGAGK